MVTVRDDIDPETVIACHNRNRKRFLRPFDFAQGRLSVEMTKDSVNALIP
jgi:hypothetical protein